MGLRDGSELLFVFLVGCCLKTTALLGFCSSVSGKRLSSGSVSFDPAA